MPSASIATSSTKLCPSKAAEEAKERNLQMPVASGGRIPTLTDADGTKYGAMTDTFEEQLKGFVEIASRADANVLEIGAAYGTPYLKRAFQSETTANYTAADLLGNQLRILARMVEETYPTKFKSNLSLVVGAFPQKEVVDALQEGGYDAILASSVFHFLTEEQLVEAVRQVYRLLKPGGKFFAKMLTPYTGLHDPDYIQKIEKDIKDFTDHFELRKRPYPYFVENMIATFKTSMDEKIKNEMGLNQKHIFLFTKEVTELLMKTEGFSIEKCCYSPQLVTSPSVLQLDGRESLVLVAQKPLS
jgi:SAM-dependent methyltransferase